MSLINKKISKAQQALKSGDLDSAYTLYLYLYKKDSFQIAFINILAQISLQKNLVDQGIFWLHKSIEINPNQPETLINLGTAFFQIKDFIQAIKYYELAANLDRNNPLIFSNLSLAYENLENFEQALININTSLNLNPVQPVLFSCMARIFERLDQIDDAIASYNKAIEIKPDYAEAYNNRGISLHAINKIDDAIASYNKAIEIKPDYAEAYNNRGISLHAINKIDDAIASYNKAIEIKPDYAEAYNNRGISLHAINKIDDAIASYNKAIEIKPDYAEAFLNKGNTYECIKKFNLSLESFDLAIKIDPDYAEAYSNKSLILLLLGDYQKGWDLFAWRSKIGKPQKKYDSKPIWLGEHVPYNNILLIHPDIGYGDFIQFSRYITYCLSYFKKIIVEIPNCLLKLFKFSNENIQVISEDDNLPNYDYHCSIMNLALATKKDIHIIPQEYLFISPPVEKINYWKNKLGPKKKNRVGICWSASLRADVEFVLSRKRSISFDQFSIIFNSNIEYHSLNKEIPADDLIKAEKINGLTLHHLDIKDFTDTAALMIHMDLIITVDTSVAHLAGALGLKTWVILPYVSDYRWGLDAKISPWYKNIEIFRQPFPGAGDKVIDAVNARLNQFS